MRSGCSRARPRHLFALAAAACAEPPSEPAPHQPAASQAVSASASAAQGRAAPPSSGAASAAPPAPGPSSAAPPAPGRPPCPAGMALIPAATFVVGASSREAVARGSPTRVEAYCLDVLEITTEQYSACVASGRCSSPLKGGSCSYQRAGAERRPINCVGVLQANAFCETRGKRLPSEAEWESAAGAGVRAYPWGDEPPGKGVCWDGAENALGYGKRHDSCEVGTFAGDVTPQGVLDLGGNLSEWTALPPAAAGKDANQLAVRRGGSWGTKAGPFLLRTTSRRVGDYKEYDGGIFTGFRCALDAGG